MRKRKQHKYVVVHIILNIIISTIFIFEVFLNLIAENYLWFSAINGFEIFKSDSVKTETSKT